MLGDLRAGADWHALGAEYWADAPPSTPLGEQDAAILGIPLIRAAPTAVTVAVMLATALTSVALLPGPLTPTVAEVNEQTPLPILAPEHVDHDQTPLYGSGSGDRRGYQIVVSTIEDCGANACSLAYFSGTKGGKPYGPRKATLANGRKGRYNPLSCGGSCSPPSITWKERGVVYEIQADTPARGWCRMANARSGGDRGKRPASRSRGGQHGVEQAREARIDHVAAQRHVPVRALGARVRQPRLAQHLEVMRAGGLGDPELERAARALAARGQLTYDRDAHRIAERGHHGRQRHLVGGGFFKRASFDAHRTKRASLRRHVRERRTSIAILPSLTAALAWGAMFPIAASAIEHVDPFR